jgi:hypothetical protein
MARSACTRIIFIRMTDAPALPPLGRMTRPARLPPQGVNGGC